MYVNTKSNGTESISDSDPSSNGLARFLDKSHDSSTFPEEQPIPPVVDALLPNTALLDEATASGAAIDRGGKIGTTEFLNLASS
jgi:hypothetical protein